MKKEIIARQPDIYRSSRIFYIIEASLEYFISLLVSSTYLAKLTSAIGFSDSLTGILSSFVSLGCGFQLVALFLANKRPVKRWVTILHTLNQLFFALVYVVPFINIPQSVKIAAFIILLLAGHALNNVVNSPKINWFMGLVDDRKRGGFTAKKEIVSLIGGVVFSFAIGQVIDRFEAVGDVKSAFIFCGVGIFILAVLHSLTLIFSKEKQVERIEKIPTKKMLVDLGKDKRLIKIILVSVLWNIAAYATTPFYGTYQVKELGFSMTFVAVLSAAYAVVRSCASLPLGKFADKFSFTKMLNICFVVQAVAFFINMFTAPSNGNILYTIYYALYAIAMAGINSGAINLVYDYVDKEKRVGALALKSTLSGFAGFFTTLLVSLLVKYIQGNGNVFLGMNVYAQQVTSALGFVLVLVILLYLNTVVRKMNKKHGDSVTKNEGEKALLHNFELYPVSSLEQIRAEEKPVMYESEKQVLANESVTFQIAARSIEKEGRDYRIIVEGEGDCRLFAVESIPCANAEENAGEFSDSADGLVPDVLCPCDGNCVQFPANLWKGFFITVKGLSQGENCIAVSVWDGDNLLGRTEYRVTVLSEKLSEENIKQSD